MASIERAIDVDVPVRIAYDQWTQFESFPSFMEGVKEVHQVDDKRLRWRAEIAGKEEEWEAEITEQQPDRMIAWRSIAGALNAGTVTFEPRDGATRVKLRIDYAPEDATEKAGSALGVVSARIQGDLDRFKEFIESRHEPTGAWRGEIHDGVRVDRSEG